MERVSTNIDGVAFEGASWTRAEARRPVACVCLCLYLFVCVCVCVSGGDHFFYLVVVLEIMLFVRAHLHGGTRIRAYGTAITNTVKSLLPKRSHRPIATAGASCGDGHCLLLVVVLICLGRAFDSALHRGTLMWAAVAAAPLLVA